MNEAKKYNSMVIRGTSAILIYEVSSFGFKRTFRVKHGCSELGDVTLDLWRVPCLSFAEHTVFIWGGTRAFRLRAKHAPEQFDFDEEISALYPVSEYIVLVCELSVRLLDNGFNELDRYTSDEVLNAGMWEAEILQINCESKTIRLKVMSGRINIL
jgi:hypothetical protein